MMISGRIVSGAYIDSVTLMAVAKQVRALPGIQEAALVMGTAANKAILESAGLLAPDLAPAGDDDLVVAMAVDDPDAAQRALAEIDEALRGVRHEQDTLVDMPRTIQGALTRLDASLALISTAGRYAAEEAFEALSRGVHVMLFSDNVPLEQEVALKRAAKERGLLVMGPDCGSALINGIPLGFANVVRRGRIGIVAASGTGLQEVSCVISNEGAGVSQAIGTGGRDVRSAVGGITFLDALRMLREDEETAVIVLISKPPDPDVARRIAADATGLNRPVVASFLGDVPVDGPWTYVAPTLEDAGMAAVVLDQGRDLAEIETRRLARRDELEGMAEEVRSHLAVSQRFVRGLFSGGTLCGEALRILTSQLGSCSSNLTSGETPYTLEGGESRGHALVDLGADEFTVGRPHPMIDYSLRRDYVMREAANSDVAVILLDVVLGYGAHPDPAGELCPTISDAREEASREGRTVVFVCSVIGTDEDPQCRSTVEEALRRVGALVAPSNAAAAYLAGRIVSGRES